MAKRRKGRTFRKKIGGEPGEPGEPKKKYPFLPVDISKIPENYIKKMKSKPISFIKPTDDDLSGGKLRRTRKRRMSKRRRNSRKSRKSKSRKMHRGGFSFLDLFRKKKQENQGVVNMTTESNSGFKNQPDEEQINRIEEINDKPEYDMFSDPDYKEQIEKNMKKYEERKPLQNFDRMLDTTNNKENN